MMENGNTQLNQLVSRIVSSYQEQPNSYNQLSCQLPNRDAIIEIIHLLRQLLFPGYFGKQNLTESTLEYHIGNLLIEINEKLNQQVTRALRHQHDNKASYDDIEIHEKTEEICSHFLRKIPEIREYLALDVQAAFDGDPAADDKALVIFAYPGLLAVSIYRLAHELYLLSVPLIPRIMTEFAHNETGIDIHAGAKIGKYFFIDHGTGVVIGETTIIGDNVKIYQGVTLGALSTRGGQSLRSQKRHPTIEDDVTVYSGASIFGGETIIGKGSVIGSNVFITQSVPPGTRVIIKNPDLIFKGQETKKDKMELTNELSLET
ncbi:MULTISPECIES: serine O-acetyltransferase EpsC [unclassified Dehalobacter]|uniref:serine O-acetyltransferase EpsC n=1 Tax=unclassified Dehalobacter TaxID=2635733 RepID=UPI000E6BD0D0|nr:MULTISPECIES: serine O-acetyltransferase EpsC [unclassified Dehalobacter]RJE48214.1 serine acetyltransferase [Dehalobacter sp. MCB1]TCX49692.1 serine acetyltransferase [Dehalobacter sp. 14DCB1]TCX50185.1 serine acetyltransferase [Dehalobacter sp. 12DCB1]